MLKKTDRWKAVAVVTLFLAPFGPDEAQAFDCANALSYAGQNPIRVDDPSAERALMPVPDEVRPTAWRRDALNAKCHIAERITLVPPGFGGKGVIVDLYVFFNRVEEASPYAMLVGSPVEGSRHLPDTPINVNNFRESSGTQLTEYARRRSVDDVRRYIRWFPAFSGSGADFGIVLCTRTCREHIESAGLIYTPLSDLSGRTSFEPVLLEPRPDCRWQYLRECLPETMEGLHEALIGRLAERDARIERLYRAHENGIERPSTDDGAVAERKLLQAQIDAAWAELAREKAKVEKARSALIALRDRIGTR